MANKQEPTIAEIGNEGASIPASSAEHDITISSPPKSYIWHRTQGKARPYPIQDDEIGDGDFCYCENCRKSRDACQRKKGLKPPCFLCYAPVPIFYCSGCVEQNWFCETFGRIGCFGHDNYETRKKIMKFGLAANCLSLILSLVACFSLSLNFDAVVFGGFSKGLVFFPKIDLPTSQLWIGLRGVAIQNFKGAFLLVNNFPENFPQDEIVVRFDSFCDYIDAGLESFMNPADCNDCHKASTGLVSAIIVSTLLILPNIATDILRMYPNYDLNCQKVVGSLLSILSGILSLYAYRGYATECFRSFHQGPTSLPFNASAAYALVDDFEERFPNLADKDTVEVNLKWKAGNGLICILLATVLKVVDIIAMFLIPTPDICHNKSLQEEYEALYGPEAASQIVCTTETNQNNTGATKNEGEG